jgi:hypothetical protein
MAKKAIITVELVDESQGISNSTIREDLCRWLADEMLAPWVKEVKTVVVVDS